MWSAIATRLLIVNVQRPLRASNRQQPPATPPNRERSLPTAHSKAPSLICPINTFPLAARPQGRAQPSARIAQHLSNSPASRTNIWTDGYQFTTFSDLAASLGQWEPASCKVESMMVEKKTSEEVAVTVRVDDYDTSSHDELRSELPLNFDVGPRDGTVPDQPEVVTQALGTTCLWQNDRNPVIDNGNTILQKASEDTRKDVLIARLRGDVAHKAAEYDALTASNSEALQLIVTELSDNDPISSYRTAGSPNNLNLQEMVELLINHTGELKRALQTQEEANASLVKNIEDAEEEKRTTVYDGLDLQLKMLGQELENEKLQRQVLRLEIEVSEAAQLGQVFEVVNETIECDVFGQPSFLYGTSTGGFEVKETPTKFVTWAPIPALELDELDTSDSDSGDLTSDSSVCSLESVSSFFNSPGLPPTQRIKKAPRLRTRPDWTGLPRQPSRNNLKPDSRTPGRRPIWIP